MSSIRTAVDLCVTQTDKCANISLPQSSLFGADGDSSASTAAASLVPKGLYEPPGLKLKIESTGKASIVGTFGSGASTVLKDKTLGWYKAPQAKGGQWACGTSMKTEEGRDKFMPKDCQRTPEEAEARAAGEKPAEKKDT